jgi:hypothetical protein
VVEQFAKQVQAAASDWHGLNLRGIATILSLGETPPQVSGGAEEWGPVPPFPVWDRECSDTSGSCDTKVDEESGVPKVKVPAVLLPEEAAEEKHNEAGGSCEVDGRELAGDGCEHGQPEFEWWSSWCPGEAKQTLLFGGGDDGESGKSESEDSDGSTPSDDELTFEQEQERTAVGLAAEMAVDRAIRAEHKKSLVKVGLTKHIREPDPCESEDSDGFTPGDYWLTNEQELDFKAEGISISTAATRAVAAYRANQARRRTSSWSAARAGGQAAASL